MFALFLEVLGTQSHLVIATVAGTILLAGFIRGFVGFGASLIIVMVLSIIKEPMVAVAIACLTGLPVMVQLLPHAVRFSERSFVVPFGLTTFVAAPFGTWALVSINADIMTICISSCVLLTVVLLYRGWKLKQGNGIIILTIGGAIAGLFQGSAGIGGPTAVAIALSRAGDAALQRANVIGAVAILNLCSLPALWLQGLFTRDVIVFSLMVAPIYYGATWVGAQYFSRGGSRHFHNAALIILAVIGLITLAISLQAYFDI